MKRKRVALFLAGEPRDDGRVSLTALWLRDDGRLRAQCFFVDPAEHFKGDEARQFNPDGGDGPALAWLRAEGHK